MGGSMEFFLEKTDIVADTNLETGFSKGETNNKNIKHAGLHELESISIAGCDLMGSALYTAGTCAFYSGKFAPVGLFLVTSMLFFFRRLYCEVVTAIPVNGGCYNLLLNIGSKKVASYVACLSYLSYTATAVLSAFDAVVYLAEIWTGADVRLFTLLILLLFATITICGIKESSAVTVTLFLLHMITLSLLITWGFAYGCSDGFNVFTSNLLTPVPEITNSSGALIARRSPVAAIYFGYCSGLLGITGFETASNYVEEMANSMVFVNTVNYMWLLVGLYNPVLSLVSMMVLDMDTIRAHPSDMLAVMADQLGGRGFSTFVCIDAVLVLCGGVMTAIVGVSGLLGRLAKDNVLPSVLARKNYRGAPYVAIIVFTGISVTLFLAIYDPTDPTAISNFGGVFAISFVAVLIVFAFGSIMLKLYRPKIARLVIAKWWQIGISLVAVCAGWVGNITLTPYVFYLFLAYLSVFVAVVSYMFLRVEILSFGIWMIRKICFSPEKQRKKDDDADNEIINACVRQSTYGEAQEVELLEIDRTQLQSMIRNSITRLSTPVKAQEEKKSIAKEGGTTLAGSVAAPQEAEDRASNADPAFLSGLFQLRTPKRRSRKEEHHTDPVVGTTGSPVSRSPTGRDSSFIDFVQQRFSRLHIYSPVRYYDRQGPESLDELEKLLRRPIIGSYLRYLMHSLEQLVSMPFCYLAKTSDPISLQLAVTYIDNNELSNNIYILHFVDDRKAISAFTEYKKQYEAHHGFALDSSSPDLESLRSVYPTSRRITEEEYSSGIPPVNDIKLPKHGFVLNLFIKPSLLGNEGEASIASKFSLEAALPALPYETQQLLHNVAILDAFYTYKKIHAVVIRGGFFCPLALDSVSEYLQIPKNNMIMGVPDTKFPFPFAKLNGVRIAVPPADPAIKQEASAHLKSILESARADIACRNPGETSYLSPGKSVHVNQRYAQEV